MNMEEIWGSRVRKSPFSGLFRPNRERALIVVYCGLFPHNSPLNDNVRAYYRVIY